MQKYPLYIDDLLVTICSLKNDRIKKAPPRSASICKGDRRRQEYFHHKWATIDYGSLVLSEALLSFNDPRVKYPQSRARVDIDIYLHTILCHCTNLLALINLSDR